MSRIGVVSAQGGTLQLASRSFWPPEGVAWSPDGSRLLFTVYGDLVIYSVRTSRSQRIWRAPKHGYVRGPDWSRDGRYVVAGSDRGLIRMALDGTGLVQLTRGDDWDPCWSPDGRTIAFWRNSRLHLVSREGRAPRSLHARAVVRHGYGQQWSPGGRSIAYTGTRGVYSESAVYTISANGRGHRQLTSGPADELVGWSPDGSKILFRREAHDPAEKYAKNTWWELWVMDADGGRQTRLPFNRGGEPGDRWSVFAADWGR